MRTKDTGRKRRDVRVKMSEWDTYISKGRKGEEQCEEQKSVRMKRCKDKIAADTRMHIHSHCSDSIRNIFSLRLILTTTISILYWFFFSSSSSSSSSSLLFLSLHQRLGWCWRVDSHFSLSLSLSLYDALSFTINFLPLSFTWSFLYALRFFSRSLLIITPVSIRSTMIRSPYCHFFFAQY